MTTLSLEERLERVESVQEIENVMGRFSVYLAAGKFQEIIKLYAEKTNEVSNESGPKGLYEGLDGIKQYYTEHHFGSDGKGTGWLTENNLTSRVIEVAKDRKTAKALWLVNGLRGGVDNATGQNQSWGTWDHVTVHFIQEEGKWKILRMHAYGVFSAKFNGWQRPSTSAEPTRKNITYHRPYDPLNKPEYVPAAPEPYDTYTPDTPLP